MGRKKVKIGKYVTYYLSNECLSFIDKQSNKSAFVEACVYYYLSKHSQVEKADATAEADEILQAPAAEKTEVSDVASYQV